jgi:hypothetical protein
MKSISMDSRPVILTEQEYEVIVSSMPQGMDGFLKTWGLLQFAAAVEDTLVRKLTVSDLVRYSDRGFQHG